MSAKREDMLCLSCYFYQPTKPGGGSGGDCRRFPPQMLAREVSSYSGEEGRFRTVESADANWPLVGEDDWCGEWRPK